MNKVILDNKEIYPSKVVCIGRNYVEHIKELHNEIPENMVFFIKPNSSVTRKLTFPKGHNTCHYEAEISFIIEQGKITAVGFGLDLTLREIQSTLKEKGLPWERAKAFDKSAVFSQFVAFDKDITKLSIQLYINGQLRQEGGYLQMIHKPQEILKEAQTFTTFENMDILMSGTPSGVGQFKVGDEFIGKILYEDKVLVQFSSVVV